MFPSLHWWPPKPSLPLTISLQLTLWFLLECCWLKPFSRSAFFPYSLSSIQLPSLKPHPSFPYLHKQRSYFLWEGYLPWSPHFGQFAPLSRRLLHHSPSSAFQWSFRFPKLSTRFAAWLFLISWWSSSFSKFTSSACSATQLCFWSTLCSSISPAPLRLCLFLDLCDCSPLSLSPVSSSLCRSLSPPPPGSQLLFILPAFELPLPAFSSSAWKCPQFCSFFRSRRSGLWFNSSSPRSQYASSRHFWRSDQANPLFLALSPSISPPAPATPCFIF